MIIFIKVVPIGYNKFVLEDNEGNNIFKKIFNNKEEAEQTAQQIRYVCLDEDEDDEEDNEEDVGKGMFWDWFNDLCRISSDSPLALIYFFDKAYQPRDENLEDYLYRIRK